ncbi:MAG: LysR family transcriptional regulator [Pseudomonadota bacterium]
MKDWDDYRLILAVSRSGSLRSAATSLGLTHTTVSRRLAIVEQNRGKLFEKQPGGYVPTRDGAALIEVAEEIERLAFAGTRFQKATTEEITGKVELSLPEPIAQYLLLEDLIRFSEIYPDVELVVETSSRFVDLDKCEADIVVRGAQEPPGHLVGRRLYPNRVTYYADRDYLARTRKEDLRWIAPVGDGLWPGWLENSPFPDVPVAVAIDDITARHLALVKGLGLGRGACFMADAEPNLVRLCDDPPILQQDLWVLTHPDLRQTPRIRAVMDFIIDAMLEKANLVSGELGSGDVLDIR